MLSSPSRGAYGSCEEGRRGGKVRAARQTLNVRNCIVRVEAETNVPVTLTATDNSSRPCSIRCVGTVFVQTGLRPFAPPARNSAPALHVIADGQDYVKSWSVVICKGE